VGVTGRDLFCLAKWSTQYCKSSPHSGEAFLERGKEREGALSWGGFSGKCKEKRQSMPARKD